MVAPELVDFARRLLLLEAGEHPDQSELADAGERVFQALRRRLAHLIGSFAAHLLLQRALRQAKVDFPFLEGVEVESEVCLKGLPASMDRHSPEEVLDGLICTVVNFINLLSTYIGEDMALLLLQAPRPDGLSGEPGSRPEGENR